MHREIRDKYKQIDEKGKTYGKILSHLNAFYILSFAVPLVCFRSRNCTDALLVVMDMPLTLLSIWSLILCNGTVQYERKCRFVALKMLSCRRTAQICRN